MARAFNVVLLEGVCYLRPGDESPHRRLMVQPNPETEPTSIYKALEPLLGEQCRVAAHHLPVKLDPSEIGFGSCLWGPDETCPWGHDERPHDLFNVSGEGILDYSDDQGWWLEGFDGSRVELPLVMALVRHQVRVAGATAMSVEEMRDAVVGSGIEGLDDLGIRAEELKATVEGLGKAVGGNDG